MKSRMSLLLSMSLVIFFLMPYLAHAVTITVDVDGTILTGTDSVVLSNSDGSPKAYAGYTIAAISTSAGPARVELGTPDSAGDYLLLKNAKITATAAEVSGHVSFRGEFSAPPTASPATVVWYQRTVIGSFLARVGNWITVTGYIQDGPPNGSWNEIGTAGSHVVTCSSCGAFSSTASEGWTSLSDPRGIKGQFSFYLKSSNDWLKLSSMFVKNTTAP